MLIMVSYPKVKISGQFDADLDYLSRSELGFTRTSASNLRLKKGQTMNTSKQVKIDLILHDGVSEGIREAWMFQPSFKIIGFPRDRFHEIRNDNKFLKDEQPGVYIIIGPKDSNLDEYYYYTGESEEVKRRLSTHLSTKKVKKFWVDTILLIGASGNNITKSQVRYIESKLFSKVSNSVRWTRWTPSGKTRKPAENAGRLPDYERNRMDEIIDQVPMLVLALGWDIFRQRIETSSNDSDSEKQNATKYTKQTTKNKRDGSLPKYPTFYFDGHEFSSKMVVKSSKEFVVTEGSTARLNTVPSLRKGILDIRKNLINAGVLKKNNSALVFTKDHTFRSTSTAAETIAGRNTRGPTVWKMKDKKTTYAEWKSRLGTPSS